MTTARSGARRAAQTLVQELCASGYLRCRHRREPRQIPYNPASRRSTCIALPSGSDLRYAVLSVDASASPPGKLEIRNADGSLDRNLWLGTEMTPLRGVIYEEGGAARIAVLRQNR